MPTGPAVAIASWRPHSFPEPAVEFARSAVSVCAPCSVARARTLLWSCASLGRFGLSVGLEMSADVLLRPSVIERFVVVFGSQPSRRRDLRTNLRHVARRVVPELWMPGPVPLGRTRASLAYSPGEMAAYLRLADAQPTEARRERLSGLICLGAGAGLSGADLRLVRGCDIAHRHGGLVVTVRGRAPRVVPVLQAYEARLVSSARFSGERFVIGGVAADRHNVTTRLVNSACVRGDLPRLEVSRLRATWLSAQAEALGLPALFAAAGFSYPQQLYDIVCRLGRPSEAELVSRLGARP
ncbi:MAG: hypothetical protein ACLPQS_02360 [Acidimicrobiales bacterium]